VEDPKLTALFCKQLAQLCRASSIGYHGNAGFKFQALLCQALDLTACRQRNHLKAIRMSPNHIQGIDAD
jgi:hypothetical protein